MRSFDRGVVVFGWILLRGWAIATRIARHAGRLVDWCIGGGRPALAGLVGAVIAVAFFGKWEILAVYLLAVLLVAAWHIRQRLVIEEITDNTPDGRLAKGAAALLAVELAYLGDAFHAANEGREIEIAAYASSSLEVITSVEDFATDLRSAVTAESKISIGPVGIPVGALLAVLGRFVQAPSLAASFHDADGGIVLAARLAGANRHGTWRIERTTEQLSHVSTRELVVRDLLSELACRIFTDLGLRGGTSWEATQHFAQAVRWYRTSLRGRGISRLRLHAAERELQAAINSDPHLFQAYYDLGVIYQEMGEHYSGHAASAFRKAAEIDTARWEPYYALAQTGYSETRRAIGDYKIDARKASEILDRCKHVIAMRPGSAISAAAYNLIGLVERQRDDSLGLPAAIHAREIASRLSLKALAGAEFLGYRGYANPDSLRVQRERTSLFLLHLAIAYAYQWEPSTDRRLTIQDALHLRRIKHVLALANRLTSSSSELHLQYGLIALGWRNYSLAERELQIASQISPSRSDIWFALAKVSAQASDNNPSNERVRMTATATRRALELTDLLDSGLSSSDIADLLNVLARFKTEETTRLKEMLLFIDEIAEIRDDTAKYSKRALARLGELQKSGRRREAGVICWLLGRLAVSDQGEASNTGSTEMAEKWYREALVHWEEGGWIEDIRLYGAHGELAQVLAAEKHFPEALDEARKGVATDVVSGWDYARLGEIYSAMSDWQKAQDAFKTALLLDPGHPRYHLQVGFCLWNMASDLIDANHRGRILAEAAQHLRDALALSDEPIQNSVGNWDEQASFPLEAHYWLGRIYTDANLPQDAIPHLLVATSTRAAPLVKLYLGQAYRNANKLDHARNFLGEGLNEIDWRINSIGADINDETPREFVAGWLHEQLAEVGVQRDATKAEVKRHLSKARHYANQLQDDQIRKALIGACNGLEGKILMREEKFDQAIHVLHRALASVADAELFASLAEAYEAKASIAIEPERELILRHARQACSQALSIVDISGRCKADVLATQVRLDRLAEKLFASIAGANTEPVQQS